MNTKDVAYLRRGELGCEVGGLGAAGAEEGARLEGDDRPRVQSQRPRVRSEVAQQARRVEEPNLQKGSQIYLFLFYSPISPDFPHK